MLCAILGFLVLFLLNSVWGIWGLSYWLPEKWNRRRWSEPYDPFTHAQLLAASLVVCFLNFLLLSKFFNSATFPNFIGIALLSPPVILLIAIPLRLFWWWWSASRPRWERVSVGIVAGIVGVVGFRGTLLLWATEITEQHQPVSSFWPEGVTDLNRDDRISRSSAWLPWRDEQYALVAAYDRNTDGVVTLDEFMDGDTNNHICFGEIHFDDVPTPEALQRFAEALRLCHARGIEWWTKAEAVSHIEALGRQAAAVHDEYPLVIALLDVCRDRKVERGGIVSDPASVMEKEENVLWELVQDACLGTNASLPSKATGTVFVNHPLYQAWLEARKAQGTLQAGDAACADPGDHGANLFPRSAAWSGETPNSNIKDLTEILYWDCRARQGTISEHWTRLRAMLGLEATRAAFVPMWTVQAIQDHILSLNDRWRDRDHNGKVSRLEVVHIQKWSEPSTRWHCPTRTICDPVMGPNRPPSRCHEETFPTFLSGFETESDYRKHGCNRETYQAERSREVPLSATDWAHLVADPHVEGFTP